MTINKTKEDKKIILEIDGKLNTGSTPQFQEAVITALDEASELILDFEKLVYLASSGIRVLVLGERKAKAEGKSIVIINVSQDVSEVFDITGLSDSLTILRSKAE